MAVTFRCEHCGEQIGAEAAPGAQTQCPHCQQMVSVPAPEAEAPPAEPSRQPPQAEAPTPKARPDRAAVAPPGGPEPAPALAQTPGARTLGWAMPWLISLFLHVGLALIAAVLTLIVVRQRLPKEVIVPNAAFSENPGGAMNPSDANTRFEDTALPTVTEKLSKRDLVVSEAVATDHTVNLMPSSSADVGLLEDVADRGRSGPRSDFNGLGGNAYHVVFVIDRSGSMSDKSVWFPVTYAMARSIRDLSDVQDFHMLFFANDTSKADVTEWPVKRLVLATAENKISAAEFLRTVMPGNNPQREAGTEPAPALQRAFEVLAGANPRRPGKLIYLLTDGEFRDNERVARAVRSMNANKEVLINTFLHGKGQPEAERVLRKIASENGGDFKLVSPDE